MKNDVQIGGSPVVSVVLPVFNGVTYLEQAVRSILAQTFQQWELLIVDDGSSDDSFGLCQTLATEDNRIQVFRNDTNKGLSRTMNRLVALARGRYIAIQEQDDVSHIDRLAREVEILDARPEVGLVSGIAEWIDDDGSVMARFPGLLCKGGQYPEDHSHLIRYLYVEQMKVVNAACMFRRGIVQTLGIPFDEEARLAADWQFALRLAHSHLIVGIPSVLVRMRRGERHASSTKKKELLYSESRRCIRVIFRDFRRDRGSPISYWLYRKAMAAELNREGRYYCGVRGTGKLIRALVYNPLNGSIWKSVMEAGGRALGMMMRKTKTDV